MWSTVLNLNPLVVDYIMVKLDYLVKFYYNFNGYLGPTMVYSFTMGIRVNLGDHMYFLTVG